MKSKLEEVKGVIECWNHSSGSLESDSAFVEEIGWVLFEDEWQEIADGCLDVSDKEKLSFVFTELCTSSDCQTKQTRIEEMMKR